MTPPFDRVALVTGAARGIGAATVAVLCHEGYRVIAVDIATGKEHDFDGVHYPMADPEDLEELAALFPDQVRTVRADVRDRDALIRGIGEAVDEFGHLDAVVAGAAVIAGGSLAWETDAEVWSTLWDVDVLGVVNTAAATVPHLLKSPTGSARFVAIASAAAHQGLYSLSAYCASKYAVVGFTKGLAADLAGTGVTACAVSPGSTDTDMLAATCEIYRLDGPAELVRHSLIRRMLEPREVAEVIAGCCAPAAAALNGSVVHADGGFA
ncbi:MAG: mycofactocin-coupled SDR family oxidoreductase [Actinomycetota bacterium]|nr:mycofactocin-coupled SDR family oxidoreductase [Actinomycetota bacterium]